jgi:N-carbamoylputrescine amidase
LGYGDAVKIAFVEWPEGLLTGNSQWEKLKESVATAHPDILVTNELPFGTWLAAGASFSKEDAEVSIRAHDKGLDGLRDLHVPAIISSRPVWNGERLANEAFVLENGVARPLHRKQYFPNETGWFESEWYTGDDSGFALAVVQGVKIGVLVCTEVMFNEHARAYGRQQASLIVVPRASGTDTEPWKLAGAMASLVSGAYVVSSNRVGRSAGSPNFGGGGFAYAPHARFLSQTDPANSLRSFDLDSNLPADAQREYPCYVRELEK